MGVVGALKSEGASALKAMLRPLIAVVAALLLTLLLVAATSRSFADALSAFVDGTVGSRYALAASINRAVALALTGLGFLFAARANLCNVGGEGQIALGGIAATTAALYGGAAALGQPLGWIYPMIAGVCAGALWGAIAGVLKVRFGTNEVISTLMLSFIGIWLVYWSTHSDAMLRQPRTSTTSLPESLELPDMTRAPLLTGDPAFPLHVGAVIAVIGAIALVFVLRKAVLGVKLRAVGANERAAYALGLNRSGLLVLALTVAGGFSGAAGALMIQGEQWNLKAGFSSGYGFDGLVIGLLARGSPIAVLAYALLFGFLRSGGISMEISGGVPSAVVVLMQGAIVILVAATAHRGVRGAGHS